MNRVRYLAGLVVPPLTVLFTLLSYALITYFVWLLYGLSTAPTSGSAFLDSATLLVFKVANQAMIVLAIAGAYLFLPGTFAAILALPIAWTWRRPLRVLVLRRFGAREGSGALRKALRRWVSPKGHVYTLADRDITVPWFIRFPVVFTQLVFLHFRSRRLKSPAAVRRLLAAMNVRWARNVNWVVSRWKTFALRCADNVWQEAVSTLSQEMDAILIDISQSSPNLEWEVRQCAARSLLPKIVFLCRSECVEEARAFLRAQNLEAHSDRLIVYDTDNVERLPTLIQAGEQSAPAPGRLRAHLAAAATMIGPFVWALIIVAGLLSLRNSPDVPEGNRFANLVAEARNPGTHDSALSELSQFILEATKTKPNEDWVHDFNEAVLPLYRELWAAEPARHKQILTDLLRSRSPAASDIWRSVLSHADQADPKDLELTLNGILAARARDNVPDLLVLLQKPPLERQGRVAGLLAELGDGRALPALLQIIDSDPSTFPEELHTVAAQALKRIALGDGPLLPHPFLDEQGSPMFVAMMMGQPEAWSRLFYGIRTRLLLQNRLQGNYKGTEIPTFKFYGQVELRMGIAGYVTGSRGRMLYQIPDPPDLGKGLVEYADRIDAGLLVVNLAQGMDESSKVQVELMEQFGVPRMAVFLDTATAAEQQGERVSAVSKDVSDVLQKHGYGEDRRLIVAGPIPTTVDQARDDGFSATIDQLLQGMEPWPLRSDLISGPVRFAVCGAFAVEGKGTLALGYVEQGTITAGQQLDVVGFGANDHLVVNGYRSIPGVEGLSGLWVSDPSGTRLQAGHLLVSPGSQSSVSAFHAYVYFLSPEQGGLPLFSILPANQAPGQATLQWRGAMSFHFRTVDVDPKNISGGFDPNDPGALKEFNIEIGAPIGLHSGQRFRLQGDEGRILGSGVVTGVRD